MAKLSAFFSNLKWHIKKILESHPLGYYIGNRILSLSSIFLPHEEDFYGCLKLSLPKNALFLDIGANDGKSARSFRKLFCESRIFSVEANPLHASTLTQLAKKIRGFDFKIGAIGKKGTLLTLYTPCYKNIVIHSAASISLAQVKFQMRKQFKTPRIVNNITYIRTSTQQIHLDDLNLDPSFIKIDIEGLEDVALQQLQETIRKHQPYLMIEYNPNNYQRIAKFLADRNYTAWGYDILSHSFKPFTERYRNCFFMPATFNNT